MTASHATLDRGASHVLALGEVVRELELVRDDSSYQPSLELVDRQPSRAERQRAEAKRQIERAVPLAQALGARAGRTGVTVGNLRMALEARGLLTGDEKGRASLIWVGRVFKAAGFKATGLFRRSVVKKTHGIPNRVWVLPEFYDEALHGEPEPLPDHVLALLAEQGGPDPVTGAA